MILSNAIAFNSQPNPAQASKIAAMWSIITFGIQYFSFRNSGTTFGFGLNVRLVTSPVCAIALLFVQASYELFLFLFYGVLWLAPISCLFRRPALMRYARFWAIMRALMTASAFLRHENYRFGLLGLNLPSSKYDRCQGYCLYDVGVALFFGLLKPWIMFQVCLRQHCKSTASRAGQALLDDSHYWCGIFDEEDEGQERSGSFLGNLSSWARKRRHSEGNLKCVYRCCDRRANAN